MDKHLFLVVKSITKALVNI